MPEIIERTPTPEETNHPDFLISAADTHIFDMGKAKGLNDLEMWASFVMAIAGVPRLIEVGKDQSISYSEEELKEDALRMSMAVYDEKKKRLICFLPSPQIGFKKNG